MPYYEHVVIARPDIAPAQAEELTEDLANFVREKGAKVQKTEYWGLRNLAYPIQKQRKGHYALINIDGPAEVIHEIERRHRLGDDIMRYLTVRVDELDEEPSPIVARRDRGDRSDRRRD